MGRKLIGVLFAFWLVVAGAVAFPVQAFAADDTFDSLSVNYNVTAEGVVQVQEKWVLRFGPRSGRHGMYRELVTREPFGMSDQDRVYEIENVAVSSPDEVSTSIQVTDRRSGRVGSKRVRIGSSNKTISSDSATYVISYDVKGALLIGGAGLPEFAWDVTGTDIGTINNAIVQARVPGGVLRTTCNMGEPRSTTSCQSQTFEGDTATFRQDRIPTGSLLTVGVQLNAGAVSNAQPILVPANQADPVEGPDVPTLLVGLAALLLGLGTLVSIPILVWRFVKSRRRDDRYAGVPPGTVPLDGASSRIVRNDPKVPIPVSFTPPKLPVAYAGYLLDGEFHARHLSATIVQLALSGAIRLRIADTTAELLDRTRATSPPAQLVLGRMFLGGQLVTFGASEELTETARALCDNEIEVARTNGWFHKFGSFGKARSLRKTGVLRISVKSGSVIGMGTLLLSWVAGPLVGGVVLALLAVIMFTLFKISGLSKDRRTALGRAWTDQVEGFRIYIATAEAEQLRFEEGEDIFTRYLPWAVLFGLTDRWVRVCERAIAMGRICAPTGEWFGSSWDVNLVIANLGTLDDSVTGACGFTGTWSDFTGTTGFGESSFDSGGSFSGGGGGGGDAGSW